MGAYAQTWICLCKVLFFPSEGSMHKNSLRKAKAEMISV